MELVWTARGGKDHHRMARNRTARSLGPHNDMGADALSPGLAGIGALVALGLIMAGGDSGRAQTAALASIGAKSKDKAEDPAEPQARPAPGIQSRIPLPRARPHLLAAAPAPVTTAPVPAPAAPAL